MSKGREAPARCQALEQRLCHAGATLRRYLMSKGKGEAPARWQEGKNHIQNQTRYPPEMLRELKHILSSPGPREPQRLRQNCVWVSPEEVEVSTGLLWGQGLWVQQSWVWHKPSWRRSPLTHDRVARTYTGFRKQSLGGHKQNRMCTRTQEKGAMTPQEIDPDLPVNISIRVS